MEKIRYSSIDLLRFIAAFSVAISHFLMHSNGYNLNLEIISSISVEVFFIISGFVLAPQIISIVENKKFENYIVFLIRRWFRTIPLYILSLTLTSISLGYFLSIDFFKYLLFFQNFLNLSVENDFFSISWSLSVEEWFYIIFPLFFLFFFRKFNFKNKIFFYYFSVIFIFLILLLRIVFTDTTEWGSSVRRIVIFRLDSIAFGFILFLLKDKIKNNNLNKILIISLIFLTTILTFNILKINALEQEYFFQFIFHYIVGIWGASIVIFCYMIDKNLKNKDLIQINLYLGKISYSIYLFHLLLIYIIYTVLNLNLIVSLIIFISTQIILSSILYKHFEKPILETRPNYK